MQPLSTPQRRWIAAGVVAFVLLSRLVTLLIESGPLIWEPLWPMLAARFGAVVGAVLVLPPAIVAIDRLQSRQDWRPVAMFLLDVVHGVAFGCVTLLFYYTASWEDDGVLQGFTLFSSIGMLVCTAATGIVFAVRRSRSVLEADALAARLQTEEYQRTRKLIETRFRPRATIAALRRIGRMLPTDPARAVTLLYRLARHERILLLRHSGHPHAAETLQSLRRVIALERRDVSLAMRGVSQWPPTTEAGKLLTALDEAIDAAEDVSIRVSTEIEDGRIRANVAAVGRGADAFRGHLVRILSLRDVAASAGGGRVTIDLAAGQPAAAGEPPVLRSDRRIFGVVLLMLAFIAVFFLADSAMMTWEQTSFLAAVSLISLLLWVVAGPLLGSIIERLASARFVVSLGEAAVLMLVAAGVITQLSLGVMALATGLSLKSVFAIEGVAAVSFRRNTYLAMAVGATSVGTGIGRLLRQRQAMVSRLQNEIQKAEAREIEACFHPHFLLNVLTSIKALAHHDPGEAAVMSRRLADLVEKIVGFSGVSYWTVRQELDLVSDYVELQRMRYKTRIHIASWHIDPAACERRLPRFVLLPLIENVFKHAVSQSAATVTAGLDLRVRFGRLRVAIWNDAAETFAPQHVGRGLSFVMHRIEGAGGVVKIGRRKRGKFLVRYSIPRQFAA